MTPTWNVAPNEHGRFRWQWHCTTVILSGLIRHRCSSWGLAGTEAEAEEKAAAHAAQKHPSA